MSADPLSKLAAKYGTDKFGYHHYTPVYDRLLRSYRDKTIRVLEIGVGGYGDADRGGQSLAMWRDYFPKASIVGIDIQPKNFQLGPRVQILRGSQVDPEFLGSLVREHGPFDIIIDDGSHRNEHVIESFELLYPTLASGGTYIVEDVQTAFFPSRGGSLELTQPNSVGFFRDVFVNPARDARFSIERVLRFHNIVAICKPLATERKDVRTKHQFADAVCADLQKNWRQMFGNLSDMQALMFDEDQTTAVITELQKLFVDVDHREIAVHFPEYETDPLAPTVYGLERGKHGTFIMKGKNDYPSNFQFDFDHPEVLAVRKEIERQLEEDPSEGGLVSYASMVSSNRGRSAARAYIARLTDMGSTSGTYFHMAIALANEDGDLGKALSVCERAVSVYPRNPDLLMALANCHLRMNSHAECLNLVDRAIAVNPRQPKFLLAGARVLLALEDATKAIELGERALALSPEPKRLQIQLFLATAHAKNGSPRLALDILEPVLDTIGNHQGAALRRASGLYRLIGNREKALETAQRACELDPSSSERAAWLAAVRKWLGVAPQTVAGR